MCGFCALCKAACGTVWLSSPYQLCIQNLYTGAMKAVGIDSSIMREKKCGEQPF
jgi:hypothetical protein